MFRVDLSMKHINANTILEYYTLETKILVQ